MTRRTAQGADAMRETLALIAEARAAAAGRHAPLFDGAGQWHGSILDVEISSRCEAINVTTHGDTEPRWMAATSHSTLRVRYIYEKRVRLPMPGEHVTFHLRVGGRVARVTCMVTEVSHQARLGSLTEVVVSGPVCGDIIFEEAEEPSRTAERGRRAVRIPAEGA